MGTIRNSPDHLQMNRREAIGRGLCGAAGLLLADGVNCLAAPGSPAIAEEVTANEWVVGPLPGTPLTLDQFPELAPLEDTESRYGYLARKNACLGLKTSREGLKSVQNAPKSSRSPSENGPSHPQNGVAEPLDNHEIWGEALAYPAIGRMAVAAAVQKAREALAASEWADLPTDLRQRIEQLAIGITRGDAQEELPDADSSQTIPWRRLLRRYISHLVQLHPMISRPPRRMPELVGTVPANVRRPTKRVVMAIIDTSGSMDLVILQAVRDELTVLARDYDLTIVECDAEIQAHYPYRGRLTLVRGRGGTDLRPPFEPSFLVKIRPDVIAYFTDGDGPTPDKPPQVPIIWCLTPDGSRPASWGREIRLGHR